MKRQQAGEQLQSCKLFATSAIEITAADAVVIEV
jgi:hypothetical protein